MAEQDRISELTSSIITAFAKNPTFAKLLKNKDFSNNKYFETNIKAAIEKAISKNNGNQEKILNDIQSSLKTLDVFKKFSSGALDKLNTLALDIGKSMGLTINEQTGAIETAVSVESNGKKDKEGKGKSKSDKEKGKEDDTGKKTVELLTEILKLTGITARTAEETKKQEEKDKKALKENLKAIFTEANKKLGESITKSIAEENKTLGAFFGGLAGAIGGYALQTKTEEANVKAINAAEEAKQQKDIQLGKQEGISQTHASVVNALGGPDTKQGKAALQATADDVVGNYTDADVTGDEEDKIAKYATETKLPPPQPPKPKEDKKVYGLDLKNKKKLETNDGSDYWSKKKAEEQVNPFEDKPKGEGIKKKENTKKNTVKIPKQQNAIKGNEPVTKTEQAVPAPKSGMKIGTIKETDEGVKYQFAGKDKNGKDIWKLPEEEKTRLMEDHKKRIKDSIQEGSGINIDEWLSAKKEGTYNEKFDKLSEPDKEKVTRAFDAYRNGVGSYVEILDKHKNKGVNFTSSELKDVKVPIPQTGSAITKEAMQQEKASAAQTQVAVDNSVRTSNQSITSNSRGISATDSDPTSYRLSHVQGAIA